MKNVLTLLFASLLVAGAYLALNNDYNNAIGDALNSFKHQECKLVRNGMLMSASSSFAHIQRKYQIKKRSIKSTDDFLQLVASASSSSSQAYQIKCQDNQAPSLAEDWFATQF